MTQWIPLIRGRLEPRSCDGPNKGKGIGLEWEAMLDNYYELMGWDRKSGKPRPETLKKYGLERQLKDLW